MADGVAITAGSGTTIATDDAGAAGHVQITKLAISTDGSATAIPADATNGLDVDVTRLPALVAGTANIGDVDVASIAAGDNNIGNVDIVTVPAPLSTTGGGTEAAALRVTVATDSTGVLSVDDNGSSLTVDGTVAATQSGTWTLGANSGVDIGDVTINNASGGSAVNIQDGGNSITVDGTVTANAGTGTFTVSPTPPTTGLLIFRSLDLDETEEQVKGTGGAVYGWYIANRATATRYVKFYNATAANVTVGSTAPEITLALPGDTVVSASNLLGGFGIAFSTAITVAATTGLTDADSGAPNTNDILINIFYI